MLLERGADANARDPEGRTALMLAAASEAVPAQAVEALIARGADVNAKDPAGMTALSFAQDARRHAGHEAARESRRRGGDRRVRSRR